MALLVKMREFKGAYYLLQHRIVMWEPTDKVKNENERNVFTNAEYKDNNNDLKSYVFYLLFLENKEHLFPGSRCRYFCGGFSL